MSGVQQVFSGGEQQRLNFGWALLLKPNLFCLDESTSQLDFPSAIGLLTLLKQQLSHTIVISVTHLAELTWFFEQIFGLEV